MGRVMKKPTLPTLLSFNAGYVDTAGFLALHGLFTAHVTGNFVTLGAALVHGSSGALAKLLALPVFCVIVVLARLLRYALIERGIPVLRTLFMLKLLLLIAGAAMAWYFGPFADADTAPAIVTGMVFVSAMALQNALQRVHLSYAPPTTLMTGTTTQIMLDLADKWHGVKGEQNAAANARLARMATNVGAFALGCGSGALFFATVSVKCFVLLPVIALLAYGHEDANAST
ncbi:membrane protein [Dyella lipolytica]|nr:membrane protein [Dyella lipolytica]